MSDDILDSVSGAGYPAIKWADVGLGNVVSGTVISVPTAPVKNTLDATKESLVFGLDVGGESRTLWVGTVSQLGSAVKEAVKSHGPATKIQVGGKLTIKWEGNEPPKQPGFSPMRVFKAKYEPPASGGVDESDIF